MQEQVEKKRFLPIYGTVIALYIIFIIVYSVVIHKASEDGAHNVDCA